MSAGRPPLRVGVGLWTMQSTQQAPRPHAELYRRLGEDAVAVEECGFDSLWLSEHRVWYDGWCPAPLHAMAFAAARTSRLRLGSAVLLAPQHDPQALTAASVTADHLAPGRIELGLGLGHRDAEFDALGIQRATRGRRMEAALQCLHDGWRERRGGRPPVWIGGMADAAVDRAARHGHGLILPQSITPAQASRLAQRYADRAGRSSRIGVLRDVWIEDDPARVAAFRQRLRRHYAEEIGSWWRLGSQLGFAAGPAVVGDQLDRLERAAAVGPADAVVEALQEWADLPVELVVARVNFDFVGQPALHEQLARLGEQVLPRVAEAAA